MAISLVQTKTAVGANYVQSLAVALDSNATAGNLLVLFVGNGGASSVADNNSNTWTNIAEVQGQYKNGALWYAKNVNAGATTVTITNDAEAWLDVTAILREYSGLDTTAPLDKSASAYTDSYVQTHSSGASDATTRANELVVGGMAASEKSPTYAAGSGYGNLIAQAGYDLYTSCAMEDKIVSSTGAQTATFSTTSYVQDVVIVATFKEEGSFSPSVSPSASPSISPSVSVSPSLSPSASPSISPSSSPSVSPSISPSSSPSQSPSVSPSVSVSPSISPSASASPSASPSLSPSESPSPSPSVSPSVPATNFVVFDGIDGRVAVADNNFDGLSAGTLEFWFRVNTVSAYQKMVFKDGCVDIGLTDSGEIFAEIGGVGNIGILVNSERDDNLEHHFAVSWDGTSLRAYIDGVYNSKTAQSGDQTNNTNLLYIGRRNTTEPYAGVIDEFRISNIARYTTETSFGVQGSDYSDDANTLVLLHFNDGTGTNAEDSSSYNNDGTLSGGVTWSGGDLYTSSASPSASPSISPSISVSPSESPSISPSASASPSGSPSASPSNSPSNSPSPSPSGSPSISPSVSISPSASISPSLSPSVSPSASLSLSPSPVTPTEYIRGINSSGGDFTADADHLPGTYDTDYHYDSAESFNYLASRGLDLIRLPIRWERIQPTRNAALDSTELARVQGVIANIKSAGRVAIIDIHNYARYINSTANGGATLTLGDDLPTADFVDLWERLSTAFKNDTGVYGYGIMNEPYSIDASESLTSAEVWESISQDVVDAIRANGDTKKIFVPGYSWSGAQTWTTNHPDPWITDAENNTVYEAHYYLDTGNSGAYNDTYATTEAAAISAGYDDLEDRVTTELSVWLLWLATYGVKGFLGEFGWRNDESTADWNGVGEVLYDLLDAYYVSAAYWATGEWWGTGYKLSAYTGTPLDTTTSVAPIIEAHLSLTGISTSVSASPSISPSTSPSVSPSASPSESPSASPSTSPSISPSTSISPSVSPSLSPSVSPSVSVSPSTSPSVSTSPSISPSVSPSVSPSLSPSMSPSISQSPSVSPSESVSPSVSPSASPSESPSPSPPILENVIMAREITPRINVVKEKIGIIVKRSTETGVGSPVYYDGGSKYDDGKYYDRWYDASGVITQGDIPRINIV